jgi:hypothetical protein
MSRTSFSGVTPVGSDFCRIFTPWRTTKSLKSSIPEAAKFVSQALKRDTPLVEKNVDFLDMSGTPKDRLHPLYVAKDVAAARCDMRVAASCREGPEVNDTSVVTTIPSRRDVEP